VQGRHHVTHSYHPHAVVFDSPGCEVMLLQMKRTFDVSHHGTSIHLQQLDITSFLSSPNLINTCNTFRDSLSHLYWFVWYGPEGKTYSIVKLSNIQYGQNTGSVWSRKGKEIEDKCESKLLQVFDWLVSVGITGGAELNDFFKWAEHLNNYHIEVMDISYNKVPNG